MKIKPTHIMYGLIILPALILITCKPKGDKTPAENADEALAKVKINPEFEMLPPIAETVMAQRIKGDDNHILFFAEFDKKTFSEKYLALNAGEKKVVLRDDGKSPDEKAGDGIYTLKLNYSVAALEKNMREIQQQAKEGRRFTFAGRSIKQVEKGNDQDEEMEIAIQHFIDFTRFRIDIFLRIPSRILTTHSLMVTDLNVVEDPERTWNFCDQTGNIDGPWTFKTLMRHLASTDPAHLVTDEALSDFVRAWLSHYATTQTINGEAVDARTRINTIITNWELKSGSQAGGFLDMKYAPFKLLAIVNRLDLRGNIGYGGGKAGEGRFVFCMMNNTLNAQNEFDNCEFKEFTVIFEYGLPFSSCDRIKNFGMQWYNLRNLEFTNARYREQLQAITDQFSKCGTSPGRTNQSSLNQLRTNEIDLNSPWELREFKLDATTHKLKQVTIEKEPAAKYNVKSNNNDVKRLVKFINEHATEILSDNFEVPETYDGFTFQGGHALTQFPPVGAVTTGPHHWDGLRKGSIATGVITDDNVRQNFSLNTCSGCHGGETQTAFTHVDPANFGTQAGLSGFLTGKPGRGAGGRFPREQVIDPNDGIMFVPDPARTTANISRNSDPDRRKFNDLQRRAQDLEDLVSNECFSPLNIMLILQRRPIFFEH